MSDIHNDIEGAVQQLAEKTRRGAFTLRVTPDELIAYMDGRLSPDEEDRLRERLALDPEATRALLDLEDPSRLDRDAGSDAFVPSWEATRTRLEDEPDPTPAALPRIVPPVIPAGVHPAYRWALAACLPLLIGLSFWVYHPVSPPSPQAGPRANVLHTELLPVDDSPTRDPDSYPAVKLAPETSHLLVIMALGDRHVYPDYQVEIVDAEGASRWRQDGFRPSPMGTFNLELPRDFLPPGRYTLRLSGLGSEGSQNLATYSLRLVHE